MIYSVSSKRGWNRATKRDLIALKDHDKDFWIRKEVLHALVLGIRDQLVVHLTGGTGVGKSTLVSVLPKNWRNLCRNIGIEYRNLVVLPVPLIHYQGPEELFTRRAIQNNGTCDEDRPPLLAAKKAMKLNGQHDVIIWFQEVGRTPPSVQNSLISGFLTDPFYDHNGKNLGRLDACVLMDSNYQDKDNGNYLLHELDAALQSRFTLQLTLDYLDQDMEKRVLRELIDVPQDQLEKLVQFTHQLRESKRAGDYKSVPFPTFRQYVALGKQAKWPDFEMEEALRTVFYGGAGQGDREKLDSEVKNLFRDIDPDSSTKTS
ncbi:MAG: AAA family ATPase [Saprospiraceae bacterium]|nr:AAA family ATPase [Saprospiraceae bacterium]